MSLLEQRPEGLLSVRWTRPDRIAVNARELERSFLLAPDQLVEDWPAQTFDAIDEAALQAVIALQPQVLLLGTGGRQRFLSPALQAWLLRQGVGVEAMDNAAAARTFNLLAQEGRHVVAAFILPAD